MRDCVRDCFNSFGGVDSIVKGRVFIKINATMPHSSAVTDPNVVISTVEVVKEARRQPDDIYVFDGSAVGFFTRLAFAVNSLAKRIKKAGATPLYLDEQRSVNLDFHGKALDRPIPIPEILYENLIVNRERNTYINIPKLKTHLQTGVTICIKNQHGLLYADGKVYNHHMINEKLIEILTRFRPDFNIVDATRVVDYGQVALSREWDIPMGLLLAGSDPVAVDTVGARLLGINDVEHVRIASERGFGCGNYEEIRVLPAKALVDEYRLKLHDRGIPLKPSRKVRLIKGKEKTCRTGCLTLGLYFIIFTHNTDYGPCIGVVGKGHDTSQLDRYAGPFVVNGPCAVSELKEYFENRRRNKGTRVYYVNEHCDLHAINKAVRKACEIPLKSLLGLSSVDLLRTILLYINAKLHKVRCKFF
jgi:uncharacterized protein (DUF362 family)